MGQVRAGTGRYDKSPDTAARDARAADLRSKHWKYADIASELGFWDAAAARKAVMRCMAATVKEPSEDVKQFELERLDRYAAAAEAVLARAHYAHSAGRLIMMEDESGVKRPVLDDGPVMAALDRLVKIQDRRAKYLGLDAPAKVDVTSRDATDVLIAELAEQIGLSAGVIGPTTPAVE